MVVGSAHVDYWTPSVSRNFRSWLQKSNPRKPKRRYEKAYAPTSINRTLATLRHFAKHIQTFRAFEAGKGNSYADVYLSTDARSELDAYIEHERHSESGPLFVTNRQGRMSRQQIDRFLRQVAADANSKLPPEERIQLHTHMLRHTSTKKVYQTKGPVEAKKFGRHRSFKQLERYATLTREEHEEMVDEGMDVDPDASHSLKLVLAISDNYYTEVAFDVPDNQQNLYIDALMGLTPRGRGESGVDDNDEEDGNAFF